MVYTQGMPWMETNLLEQREKFIAALESGLWSMSELCARFGISRTAGYKWRARAAEEGGLADRRHAPHRCPHRTGAQVEGWILAARRQYGWGAKKLLHVLARRHPRVTWPARS